MVTDRPFIPPVRQTTSVTGQMQTTGATSHQKKKTSTQPVEVPGSATTTQPDEAPSAVIATWPVEAPGASTEVQPTGQDACCC